MIPYEELDRALARWKARGQGGPVEPSAPEAAAPEVIGEAEVLAERAADSAADADATPLPIRAEDLGSIPNQVAPAAGERTGEIDVNELETYEDQ
jgi:hypothetical protein